MGNNSFLENIFNLEDSCEFAALALNLCAAQKLDIYSKNGAVAIQKDWWCSHFIKVHISLKFKFHQSATFIC